MKKYLMTGIAALAITAAFTSCSHNDDIEVYTQSQIDKAKYDQAFLNYIGGKIAEGQDWGFSASIAGSRMTRAHDVNGNLWYQNWVRPINVGDEVANEEAIVLAEFQKLRTNQVNTINIDWENYWVQQVHQSTNSYNNLYGNSTGDIHASMNKIIAYNEQEVQRVENGQTFNSHYEHVNNFNNGTNTTEYTDDVTNEKFIGTTLMKNMGQTPTGTPKFGYHNTNDSKDHFEYIIIPGSQIFPNNPEMHKYYYVGFDYQANDEETETTFRFRPTDANADQIFNVKGVYRLPESNGQKVKTTVYADNGSGQWVPTEVEYTIGEGGTWSIDNYQHGNMWIDRDWRFDDWIVRISPAEQAGEEEEVYDLRIMGEDLSATEAGDFDFNDIVLDVKFAKTGETTTKVCLRAAGGTLPLYIIAGGESFEVHDLFKVGTGVMVNTAAGHHFDVSAVEFELKTNVANAEEARDKIVLKVDKNGELQELTARISEPAAKIAITSVAPGDWLDERVSIKDVKTQFVDWATAHRSRSTWWNE